jgi:YesN/AraC family two-component response regulator
MLGVNLCLDNYTVLIFSVSPTFYQGKEKMASLFDYLLSFMVGNYISHFYFESATVLVCIVSSVDSGHPIRLLFGWLEKARYNLNFSFFTSIGSTVDNYEDVTASYHCASKYRFLQYSTLTDVFTDELELPRLTANAMEQDYSEISCEEYLRQLHHLFLTQPASRHRALILNALNWGISQASPDDNPDEQLAAMLGTFPLGETPAKELLPQLDAFVGACYETLKKKQAAQTATYPYVDTVIEAVHNFSDKDISLKTLAAKLNMHPSYLGNIFHQQTGYYFSDYLNEERLKYAAGLIRDTDMKLKDIVDLAGFSSQTYFNRLFHRKYGMSPNTYRREVKFKSS